MTAALSIGFLIPKEIALPKTGGEWYNYHLVTGLRNRGHDITLLSTEPWNRLPEREAAVAINAMLAQYRNRFSVLLVDTWLYRFLHRSSVVLSQMGCPVVSFHQLCYWDTMRSVPSRFRHYWKTRKALKGMNGHIGVSQTVLKQDGCKVNSRVIYPGCDFSIPTHQPLAKKAGELKLISVGNYTSRKGHHILIEALAKIKKNNDDFAKGISLQIVGNRSFDSAYTNSLEKLVSENGLQNQVQLCDWMNREQLATAFQQNHGFAFASAGEGFGMVVLEALVQGLPAMLSPLKVFKEILGGNECGEATGNYARLMAHWKQQDEQDFATLQQTARRRGAELAKPWEDVVGQFEDALAQWGTRR